jgi:cell division initiation protein
MALRSLDIEDKKFNSKFNGYNKEEVDDFLDLIIRDYDEFSERIRDLERDNKSMKEKVEYYEGMKEALNKSILVAQSASDDLKRQSQMEASTVLNDATQKSSVILENAKKEAGNILTSASQDARRLVQETDELKRKMRVYHQRMTLMVEAQLENVKSLEWEEIFKPTTSYIDSSDDKLKEIVDGVMKATPAIETAKFDEEVVTPEAVDSAVTSDVVSENSDSENALADSAVEVVESSVASDSSVDVDSATEAIESEVASDSDVEQA